MSEGNDGVVKTRCSCTFDRSAQQQQKVSKRDEHVKQKGEKLIRGETVLMVIIRKFEVFLSQTLLST
jgi:hypothetical protein